MVGSIVGSMVGSTVGSMVDFTVRSIGCTGLSTSAKRSTAQTRGFYRGFKGLVIKQTRRFTDYYNSYLTLL
jgi:hypothetical protein